MLSVAGYVQSFDIYKLPYALAWQTTLWFENCPLFHNYQGRPNCL